MRKAGNVGFMAATIILILVAAFFATGTVMSRTDLSTEEKEYYYLEQEEQLLKNTRELLNDRGFSNSGVMVERVVEENGNRRYTVFIHHKDIDQLPDEEKEELLGSLQKLSFQEEQCSFRQVIE